MWPNPQFPADLVTFTEEILMENLIFCAVLEFVSLITIHFVISFDASSSYIWCGSSPVKPLTFSPFMGCNFNMTLYLLYQVCFKNSDTVVSDNNKALPARHREGRPSSSSPKRSLRSSLNSPLFRSKLNSSSGSVESQLDASFLLASVIFFSLVLPNFVVIFSFFK